MTFFYLDNSPEKQYLRAENYYKRIFGNKQKVNKIKMMNGDKKIRIGYISANFNDHPVMKVMESIFKDHDKNCFEVYAYSLVDFEDNYTKKIKKYFSSFKSIGSSPLKDAINIIRSDELDIAVDLMGYTNKNRIELFNELKCIPIKTSILFQF